MNGSMRIYVKESELRMQSGQRFLQWLFGGDGNSAAGMCLVSNINVEIGSVF